MVEREKSASYSSLTVNTLLSLVILSQIFKYLAPYENIRIEYLLSIGIVSFFFLTFQGKVRFLLPFVLMALPVIFIYIFHSYIHQGLLLMVLLGVSVSSLNFNEKKINAAFDLLFYSICLLALYGVLSTGDPNFLRAGLAPIPFQNVSLFFSSIK